MDWNTVFIILEDIFYPLIIILSLIGLFMIFLGINRLRKRLYSEPHISQSSYDPKWYRCSIICTVLRLLCDWNTRS